MDTALPAPLPGQTSGALEALFRTAIPTLEIETDAAACAIACSTSSTCGSCSYSTAMSSSARAATASEVAATAATACPS